MILDRNRGGSYLASLLVGAGMLGTFLFLTYFFQGTLHYSALKTGFAFLPFSGGIIIGAGVASRFLPRIGPRALMIAGLALAAGGLVWFTGLTVDSSYLAHVLPPEILVSLGMGMAFVPMSSTALIGVEPNDAGVASALVNTTQQVGGSLGHRPAQHRGGHRRDHLPRRPRPRVRAAVRSRSRARVHDGLHRQRACCWPARPWWPGVLVRASRHQIGEPEAMWRSSTFPSSGRSTGVEPVRVVRVAWPEAEQPLALDRSSPTTAVQDGVDVLRVSVVSDPHVRVPRQRQGHPGAEEQHVGDPDGGRPRAR